ncbi:unnamed protein product [Heligmosomoides polygyrus]|uniref:Uncharacterized protein n=1 Tax=Heligmosomoides polygyrus TaxID=6339 RepID=A0A183GDI1_HELPZ|nr:unnamed protein product [Heligmosomoides polygyrus]
MAEVVGRQSSDGSRADIDRSRRRLIRKGFANNKLKANKGTSERKNAYYLNYDSPPDWDLMVDYKGPRYEKEVDGNDGGQVK